MPKGNALGTAATAPPISLHRAIASNVVVQALGPACGFATVFMIARLGGPSAQGQFAHLKAWVDLLAAIGCFGFPQSFVYVINKLGASAPALARFSVRYSLAFLPLALAGALVAHLLGSSLTRETGVLAVALATAGSSMLVLHGLWRGIYLTRNSGTPFALFTILPAVALLATTAVTLVAGSSRFEWAILGSAVAALAGSAWFMRDIGRGDAPRDAAAPLPWGPLVTNGVHSFAQALLLTLQPLMAYSLIRLVSGTTREIGLLNVGLVLVQGLTMPIGLAAPILFTRWTSRLERSPVARLHALTLRGLAAGAALGALLALAAGPVIPFVFGAEYAAAVPAARWMLFTVPLVCHGRIIAPALHAIGRPGLNTTASAIRIASFSAASLLLVRNGGDTATSVAAAWTLGEVFAAAWLFLCVRYAARDATPRGGLEFR